MFLPLYLTKSLAFTDMQIGFLIGGCYGMGSILGGLLGGKLTSSWGPIKTQVASLSLTVPGYLLLAQADRFVTVALCLFGLSVVNEMIRPASVTATTLYCPSHLHKRAMGHNRLAVNLGTSIGGVWGGVLAGINYQLLFYANASTVFAALIATLICFKLREPETQKEKAETGNGESPWSDRSFLWFLFFTFLTAVVFFQLLSTFPKYLDEQRGVTEFYLGALMAINTLLIVILEMYLVQVVSKFSVLRVVAWGSLMSCVGFGLLPFCPDYWYICATVVVWTFGEMLAMPLSAAYVAARSSERSRGRYMGLYVTCYAAALVIGPLLGMAAYELDPDLVWYIALALGWIAFSGYWWLSVQDKTKSNIGDTDQHPD